MLANGDLFASWETIEILKGFISVISVFPGGFHIQGSGRESKHTINTHTHTHTTLLYRIYSESRRPPLSLSTARRGRKSRFPQPRAKAGSTAPASEVLTRTRSRGYMCMLTSTEEIGICASLSCLSSLPPWLPVEWFTPRYARRLSGELLPPINFVIHLQQSCSVHK